MEQDLIMPVSASQHRVSAGTYQNKLQDNIRGSSTTQPQSLNSDRSAIPDEIRHLGSSINRAVNSHEELSRPSYQTTSPRQGLAAPLLMLLSQVRLDGIPVSSTTDISAFTSERSVSPPVSRDTAHSDNSGNGFSTMLSPLANALYETGQFIARHDPLRFPGAEAAALNKNQYTGKEGDSVQNIEGNKNYYSVARQSLGTNFIDNGKQALVNFNEKYESINIHLKKLAHNILREKIKTRFHMDIDPDKVNFIHFADVLYNGDKKIQSNPRENRSLTEYLFTNFDKNTQLNLVDMDAMCGIYDSSIKTSDEYNAKDAINIKPTQFIDLVWDIDFYNYAKNKVIDSLDNHKDTHIKKHIIDLINDLDISSIDNDSARDVLSGVGVLNNNVSVTLFDINGYTAANAFVFKNNDNGNVILYLPNGDAKFIKFRGDFEMRSWVTYACDNQERRDEIASHFSIANRQDGTFYYGVDEWLRSIYKNNDYYDRVAMKSTPVPPEHFFDFLHNQIKDKTLSDLDSLIKSDDEVRRDMWEDIIDASNIIPNPVSPFLSLGIHIEHLIDADTYEEKVNEWEKIKYDAVNLISMVLLDKTIKLPDVEGYDFIKEVKSGFESEIMRYEDQFLEKKTDFEREKIIDEGEIEYDKEKDCFRVKRGAVLGKMCSDSVSPEEEIIEFISYEPSDVFMEERVDNECKRILQHWEDSETPLNEFEDNVEKLSYLASNMVEDKPVLDDYIKAGNDGVNNYLRYGQDTSTGEYAREAVELGEEYNELNSYDDFSYRIMVMPRERVESLDVGDIVADKGFSSSSALLNNAKDWINSNYIKEYADIGDDFILIVYDKDIPKKIAGNHFLIDHILIHPSEKIKIITKATINTQGKSVTIIGAVKYKGDIPSSDIYTGQLHN